MKRGLKNRTFTKDLLEVRVFPTREEMGLEAARDVSRTIRKLLQEQEEVNMIFAAAPSQNDFIQELITDGSIDWNRINAFHMDEYIGLDSDAPQAFGNFLKERIFNKVPLESVHLIDGSAKDSKVECHRYADLLTKFPADIVCCGIGENGHIAFNDPPVADFNDPALVKVVELEQGCRQQQVNDNCFLRLEDVPMQAYTLTIPALMGAVYLFCIVPTALKAQAVYDTINGEVHEKCPASVLREKEGAILYIDEAAASLL